MMKYVMSDIDLDLYDGNTVSKPQPVLYPWYFFFILAISEGIV